MYSPVLMEAVVHAEYADRLAQAARRRIVASSGGSRRRGRRHGSVKDTGGGCAS